MEKKKDKPDVRPSLLWEYDLETFNWERSYKIVIERVIQLGNIKDWREAKQFYGSEKIIETANWSKQLDKRDKNFAQIFLNSDLLHVA